MSNNNNFSVIYFSIFTPKIFQTKIKNQSIKDKEPKNSYTTFKTSNNILIKKVNSKSSQKVKPIICKTAANLKSNNLLLFRDYIKENQKKKTKRKFKIAKSLDRPGSSEPYKQYILEKREIEENRKRRDIEKKYIIESKRIQELKLLNDIKFKYDGYDFSRQQKKIGFLDKYIESKNYSKEKTKNFNVRPISNFRKNSYQYYDAELLEDIKTNKRKNVFEEDFDVKSSSKYIAFRAKAISFIKSLRHNPNYNYWIRKDN